MLTAADAEANATMKLVGEMLQDSASRIITLTWTWEMLMLDLDTVTALGIVLVELITN